MSSDGDTTEDEETVKREKRIVLRKRRRPAGARGFDSEHPLSLDSEEEEGPEIVELDAEESEKDEVAEVLAALGVREIRKEETLSYRRPFSSRAPALCVYVAAAYPPLQDIQQGQDVQSSFAVQFKDWDKQRSGLQIPNNERPKQFSQNVYLWISSTVCRVTTIY